jgi:hypothetical protein
VQRHAGDEEEKKISRPKGLGSGFAHHWPLCGRQSGNGKTLFFARDFRAPLAGFGKSDGNGLLSACHLAAFSTFARAECSALFFSHGALDAFSHCLSVSGH